MKKEKKKNQEQLIQHNHCFFVLFFRNPEKPHKCFKICILNQKKKKSTLADFDFQLFLCGLHPRSAYVFIKASLYSS